MLKPYSIFSALFLMARAANAEEAISTYRGIEDDRTTETRHGLYEIREAAQNFLTAQNQNYNRNWSIFDPNLKTVVARCFVPLKLHGYQIL